MAEKYDFMENFDKNNERFKTEISKYIDDYLNGVRRKEGHIVLGETPPVLSLAGADSSLKLVIPHEQINHIIDKHIIKRSNYERLRKENVLDLYNSLTNPICLFSGSEKGSCVVITDFKNQDGLNIQVPIFFNMSEEFITVNDIATQYPNRTINEYITKEIMKHNLVAANNKKLEDLLRTIGLLLPVVNTNSSSTDILSQNKDFVNSYDDTIIHNLDNVKYANKYVLRNVYYEFPTENKFFKPIFKANYLELYEACKELNWGDPSWLFDKDNKIKSEILKYPDDIKEINNKLIELKTNEIEKKLEEIKNMLKREEIKANELKVGDQVSLPDIGLDRIKSIKINDLGKVDVSFENASMGYVFDKDDNITVFNDTSKTKDNVQNVIDVKEFIENNIKSYLQGNGYKDAITLDQKIVNQYEYLEKHFINDIKEQKGVGYHAAKGAALGLFMDDPTIESKLYPDYKGDVFEKYCKDCSIVFDDMYKQSKENLLKIREDIKEQLKETINDFNGKTFDEKMLNFYDYYKDTYEKQHDLSEDKGVGYNFAKDGNGACLIYYVDFREFYGYEKEKSSLDFKMYEEFRNYKDNIVPKENENLYNIYLKDVDSVCKEMYNEAFERIKENSKYGQAIKEVEEKDEKDTLLEDSKNIISDKQKEDKLNEVRDKNNDNDKEKSSKNSKGREE